jgi:hypothetical protein
MHNLKKEDPRLCMALEKKKDRRLCTILEGGRPQAVFDVKEWRI